MKVCGQVMKVTLNVHGRERTFSEQELIAILEKHFPNEATNVAQVPTEGKWFEVNPQAINRSLFQKQREGGTREEWVRQIIQEAFAEVDKNPAEYALPFYTLIPEEDWSDEKTIAEINSYAYYCGGRMADWAQQALEWAQRIFNGESWETICYKADTANWYRMILWKNGYYRIVGGSRNNRISTPTTVVGEWSYYSDKRFDKTAPLVVLKKN